MSRQPMSSVDRAWLLAERPTNRMVINGLWIFKQPFDYHRLIHTLAERMLSFRRFRQRVVDPPGSIGRAYWEDDPNFDLRAHVRRIALPAPGNKAMLQELVGSLISAPLDQSKPLWEFYLIEEYEGGSALLGRIHHCIADGVALVRVMLSLTDPTPEDSWQTPAQRRDTRWNPLKPFLRTASAMINNAVGLSSMLAAEGMEAFTNPDHLRGRAEEGALLAGKTAGVLGKLALMTSDDRTVFKGKLGVTKAVAWSDSIQLDEVKFIKNRTGTTVNDVLVSVLTGALRRYMIENGDDPTGREVRAMVPVNTRPAAQKVELGNQFALVYLTLPVGIADPLDRLFAVKRRMDRIKQTPEAEVTYQIISGLGLFPDEAAALIKEYFASKASAVLTNVPGPAQKLYFAGTPLDKMIFWVPQSGSIGMGLSILSYGGEVTVGVMTDDHLVPDPESIIDAFGAEFEALHQIARLPDEEQPDTEQPDTGGKPSHVAGEPPADQETTRNTEEIAEALLAQFLLMKETPVPRNGAAADPEISRCHALTRAGDRCKLQSRAESQYCHLHEKFAHAEIGNP